MPEGRSIAGLDKSKLGLFPARVETLCGLVFVNLDVHATPLADQVTGLPERLERYGIEHLVPSGEWHNHQPSNWKIVIDNYNEGYHVPIAHPGLMRLLDYKHYDVEVHDGWVWFEAPFRDKPSSNLLERAYQRMVSPMPGLTEADRRVWRYVMIYPNTDDRPVSRPGRDLAHRPRRPAARPRRGLRVPPPSRRRSAPASPSGSTTGSTRSSAPRTPTSSRTSRRASRLATSSSGRCRTARRPSPGSPTGSGRTSSDRHRHRPRRPRAHPRRGGRADRTRRHRRGPHRADRYGRGRVHLARPLPLRDPRRAPGTGARVLATSSPATSASAPRATRTTLTARGG